MSYFSFPVRVMTRKPREVTNPPDMVSHATALFVGPLEGYAGYFFAERDGFEHRAITKPAAADIVDLPDPGCAIECVEGLDQVEAVNVVANLFALVSEDLVGSLGNTAFH